MYKKTTKPFDKTIKIDKPLMRLTKKMVGGGGMGGLDKAEIINIKNEKRIIATHPINNKMRLQIVCQ